MVYIAPSMLAADFSQLGKEIEKVEAADMLHIDIMDGHFVPNISIGPAVVAALRNKTQLVFDVHLMMEDPLLRRWRWSRQYGPAGQRLEWR